MAVVSPDGRLVATGGEHEHCVRLWDVETGEELDRVEGFQCPFRGLAFSPDGLSLVAGGRRGRTKLSSRPPEESSCGTSQRVCPGRRVPGRAGGVSPLSSRLRTGG